MEFLFVLQIKQTPDFPVVIAIDRAVLLWGLNFSGKVFKMIKTWLKWNASKKISLTANMTCNNM